MRKIFVLREVEVTSLSEVKEGDIFRLEATDPGDLECIGHGWNKAVEDGKGSKIFCDPVPRDLNNIIDRDILGRPIG